MTNTELPSKTFLWVELLLMFIGLPLTLALTSGFIVNAIVIISALVYVGIQSKKMWTEQASFAYLKSQVNFTVKLSMLWPRILIMFLAFALLSFLFVRAVSPDILFNVLLNNPMLWIAICFFYSAWSVFPQEFVYRTYFFKRYRHLVLNKWLFILLNAVVFCGAHLMFNNGLVLLLTFGGGLLFAYTYNATRSIKIVFIEHVLYGLWLFTVGMGSMLAFPGA